MMMVLQTEMTEESAAVGPVTKKRLYNARWTEDRPWLCYDCEQVVMYCGWYRDSDRNTERNQFVIYESQEYQKPRSFTAAQRF